MKKNKQTKAASLKKIKKKKLKKVFGSSQAFNIKKPGGDLLKELI